MAYRQRSELSEVEAPDTLPAIADAQLFYIRLHRDCFESHDSDSSAGARTLGLAGQLWRSYQSQAKHPTPDEKARDQIMDILDFLSLPSGADEWSVPDEFRYVRDLRHEEQRPRAGSAILLEREGDDDSVAEKSKSDL